MEIRERINVNKEDIYNMNMYLLSHNKNLGLLVVGTGFIGLGIYDLIKNKSEELIYNILLIVVGVLGIFFALVVNKYLLQKKMKKNTYEDMPPIEVTANNDGILYKYIEEENQKEYLPYKWNEVLRVVKTEEYIYIHLIDRRSIMLIPLRDLKNDKLLEFLKEKYIPLRKYIEKKK